jgi:hypothetical protein
MKSWRHCDGFSERHNLLKHGDHGAMRPKSGEKISSAGN